jgi:hypothetical protein
MLAWTSEELSQIAAAEELELPITHLVGSRAL